MKKFLFSIMIMILVIVSVNVSAATSGAVKNIKIQDVNVEVSENIGYNEKLTVKYSVNPRDASNLNITWSVTGLKKGTTLEFVSSNKTNSSDGEIELQVNNTNEKDVTLYLVGKQNGKTISKTKLVVENKSKTIERVTEEVKNLISNLDEKINKNNFDENKEAIAKINELLENNSEIKDALDSELSSKLEDVKTAIESYETNSSQLSVKIISIALVVIFSALIFWIFKKED